MTLQDISECILPALNKSFIEKVIVFGSYANGTATLKSDIDLVIDSNGRLDGMNFFVFADEIAGLLPIKSDIFELMEIIKPSPLYEKIMKEGVVIYERERLLSF